MWICADALSGCSCPNHHWFCSCGKEVCVCVSTEWDRDTLTSGLHMLPSQEMWRACPAALLQIHASQDYQGWASMKVCL